MGLNLFGNEKKTTSQQQTASELTDSVAVFGANNQITYSDYGAISEASALAQTALRAGMEQQELGAELSYRTSQLFGEASSRALETASSTVSRFGESAFSTVENALGRVSSFSGDAISQVASFGEAAFAANDAARRDALASSSSANAGALDAVVNIFRDSFTGITSFMRDLQGQSSDQIGSTVTALNTIAKEQNTSADQRVADISSNAIKYVVIGLGVLAVGVAGVLAFKR